MAPKRIKCEECSKTQDYPLCCQRPMEFEETSWICSQCQKKKKILCCEKSMTPETDEDIDVPEEIVDEFEEFFAEEKAEESGEKRPPPDYVG